MASTSSPSTGSADPVKSSDNKQSSLGKRGTKRTQDVEPWDDFQGYIKIKRRKQDNQFKNTAQVKKTDIFKGVTIYVNGWTQPNAIELKRLMHDHGGNYVYNTWSGSGITHVIATNLPHAKIRNIGDTVVCSPDWIVDSIAAGKQLPMHKYQLYGQNGTKQRRLHFRGVEDKTKPRRTKSSKAESTESGVTVEASNCEAQSSTAIDPLRGAVDPLKPVQQTQALTSVTPRQQGETDSGAVQPATNQPVSPNHAASNRTDLVGDFYTHSRLHHLSTWSSELKQFTYKTLPQISPKYPKLPPTVSLRALKLRAVVHIDIDCFFVSVSIKSQPHLKGKPVAVAHAKGRTDKGKNNIMRQSSAGAQKVRASSSPDQCSDNNVSSTSASRTSQHLLRSVSDIASCSYEARRAGVHNGMWVGEAMKLCPGLELVPYDFDGYHQVSCDFYMTLMKYSSVIEPVSCDEAYIELTDYADSMEHVQSIVHTLRDEVLETTGCTVSAGISHNMLLARMATRLAKPNGQFYLARESLQDILSPQPVCNLPGVGYSTTQKLKEMNIETCSKLKSVSLSKLQAQFGVKTGRMLYDYSRGIDNRELKLEPERKSLSADMNFGIRFSDLSEAVSLLTNLATEVEKRAEEAQVLANSVTLKLKIRKPNAPVHTRKYLGHGPCDNITRTHSFPHPTRTASDISKVTVNLFKQLNLSPADVRGVGIQLNKLVSGLQSTVTPAFNNIQTLMSKATSEPDSSKSLNCVENGHLHDPPLPHLPLQIPLNRHKVADGIKNLGQQVDKDQGSVSSPQDEYRKGHLPHSEVTTNSADCSMGQKELSRHFKAPAHSTKSGPRRKPLSPTSKMSTRSASISRKNLSHQFQAISNSEIPSISRRDISHQAEMKNGVNSVTHSMTKTSCHSTAVTGNSSSISRRGRKRLSLASKTSHLSANPPNSSACRTDLSCHSKADPSTSSAMNSEGANASAMQSDLDDSFAIELPPASQLDTSVLQALPSSLQDRILRTYSEGQQKSREHDMQLPSSRHHSEFVPELSPTLSNNGPSVASFVTVEEDETVQSTLCSVSLNSHSDSDSDFLSSFRFYLKDWVEHFPSGPVEEDVYKVLDYLLGLSTSNLTVLLGILKYFRRLLVQRNLVEWYCTFNLLLSAVQVQVQHNYTGTLEIAFIIFPK